MTGLQRFFKGHQILCFKHLTNLVISKSLYKKETRKKFNIKTFRETGSSDDGKNIDELDDEEVLVEDIVDEEEEGVSSYIEHPCLTKETIKKV